MKGASVQRPRDRIQGSDVLQALDVVLEAVLEAERQQVRFPFELRVDEVPFLPSRESE